ncbi:MAG TPA: hypothetical protein PKA19_01095 [Bacillota bacterium]|nr:hypothetical protein [Bacillota bacterium]
MKPYTSNAEYLQDLAGWGRLLLTEQEEEAAVRAARMEERSAESLKAGIFLPLEYLFLVFQLNRFERHCVRMSLLPELELLFEGHFAFFHKDPAKRLLSLGLAIRFYGGEDVSEYHGYWSKENPLRRYFFQSVEGKDCSDLSMLWKLDQRILHFVLEGRMDNPDLAEFSFFWEPDRAESGKRERKDGLTGEMIRLLEAVQHAGEQRVVFFLTGPAGVGKKYQFRLFCGELERAILFIDLPKMLLQNRLSPEILELLCRESVIRQAVLCFAGLDALLDQGMAGEELAAAWLGRALAVSWPPPRAICS